MATRTQTPAEQIKLLNAARSGSVNFGVCMGRTPETTILLLDRSKAPRTLASTAKAMGETPKVFFGDLEVDGARARFLCESDPPSGAIGMLRKLFEMRKLGFRPEFSTDLDKDLKDGVDGAQMLDRSDMSPEMKKWEKIDAAIEAKVRALLKMKRKPPPGALAAWKEIRKRAARGQVRVALRGGAKVLKLMDPPAAGASATPAGRKGAMLGLVRQMARRLKGRMTPEQERYLRAAASQARRGADDKAAALLRAVQKAA